MCFDISRIFPLRTVCDTTFDSTHTPDETLFLALDTACQKKQSERIEKSAALMTSQILSPRRDSDKQTTQSVTIAIKDLYGK